MNWYRNLQYQTDLPYCLRFAALYLFVPISYGFRVGLQDVAGRGDDRRKNNRRKSGLWCPEPESNRHDLFRVDGF